ncbi:MAG: hypothetical protein R2854_14900 [Caldilineaceae bacterium]
MNGVVIESQRPDAPEAAQLIWNWKRCGPALPPTSRHGFSIGLAARTSPFFVVRHQEHSGRLRRHQVLRRGATKWRTAN